MKLCVTGATGFLGRYVVSVALSRGHTVRALVHRPADLAKLGWKPDDDIEQVKVDLRSKNGLVDAVRGCDAVLHLAATKAGDLYAQFGGTVVATENLLWAMGQAECRHVVGISSFAVYDYLHKRSFSTLDETSPLDEAMVDRDEYAQTKLIQEKLIRDTAAKNGWTWTVLRPGMIYGRDNLFNARVGMGGGGRTWVRTGAWAQIPLTYVENCAEAIVMAAETPAANGQVLNLVDDKPADAAAVRQAAPVPHDAQAADRAAQLDGAAGRRPGRLAVEQVRPGRPGQGPRPAGAGPPARPLQAAAVPERPGQVGPRLAAAVHAGAGRRPQPGRRPAGAGPGDDADQQAGEGGVSGSPRRACLPSSQSSGYNPVMVATKEAVIEQALALSDADRREVIGRLAVSLAEPTDVTASWDTEIDRRLDAGRRRPGDVRAVGAGPAANRRGFRWHFRLNCWPKRRLALSHYPAQTLCSGSNHTT